jgi:hypothetical protein
MFMTTLLFASCNLSLRPSVDHQLCSALVTHWWSLRPSVSMLVFANQEKVAVGQCSVSLGVPLRFGCFHSLLYTRCTLTRQVELITSHYHVINNTMWRRGWVQFHWACCLVLFHCYPCGFPPFFKSRAFFFLASKNRLCNKQRSQ